MGLFDFFKKKEAEAEKKSEAAFLAMALFKGGSPLNTNEVAEDLRNHWGLPVVATGGGDNNTDVFTIDGSMVGLTHIPMPIPGDEISECAQLAYNWDTAMEDLKDYSSHAVVFVKSNTSSALDQAVLLSKTLASILSTSDAVGIYQGSQSLLIPKDQYLTAAQDLKEGGLPIQLWVYFGLRKSEKGNSIYTYGLSNFGKNEMEVVHSALDLEELYSFMANICSYVIGHDVTFKHGETLGYTEDQKVKITQSKGHYLAGQTLKLEM